MSDFELDLGVVTNTGGTSDFDELSNRPSYNGTAMTHATNIPEVKTSAWDAKADTEDIPTKTSELTNDSGFITEHQSLSAYRTSAAQDVIDNGKADVNHTHTTSQITDFPEQIITKISAGTGIVTDTTSGQATIGIDSAVQASLAKADSAYQKPSGGIPSSDMASAVQTSLGKADTALQEHQSLANYYNKTETDDLLDDKQDALPTATNDRYLHTNSSTGDLEWSEVTSGGTWGSITGTLADQTDLQSALDAKGTYSKPSAGIPKTDLVSAVQTSLGLADTSEQKSRMVTSISDASDNEHYPSAKAVYNAFGGLFTVVTTANNTNWGTVSAGGTYLNGTQITVTATSNSGYSFVAWKNVRTNEVLSQTASYTFTVSENIGIKAVFQDESYVVPSWASGTDAEIAQAVSYHYDGLIDLSLYWSIGDTRTVSLSAMAADSTKGYEAHAAQSVDLVLMDSTCTGFTLTDTGNAPAFIVGQKDGLIETGQMNSSNTNAGGWGTCKRRGWCNDVYRLAIPSTLRGIFKQFNWQYVKSGTDGTLLTATDYFAMTPEYAVFNSGGYSRAEERALFSQWSWYQTAANRKKYNPSTGSASNWWECSPYSGTSGPFCSVNGNGSAGINNAGGSSLLAPFGCI